MTVGFSRNLALLLAANLGVFGMVVVEIGDENVRVYSQMP
jgi:hypothetical protein